MEQRCCVCNEPLDTDNIAQCRLCGGHFHMAWSTEAQVKECGHYGMFENLCGLVFVCALCEKGLLSEQD